MPNDGESPTYRIERRGAGILHLYRGGELVDVDHEEDGDSRSDIERWGTAVAWAEDHTGIERWGSPDPGDLWRTLVGIPYWYVTWQLDDNDVAVWDELDSTNWATRHIEAKNPNQVYTAAASLEEAIAARDTGGIEAVRSYEQNYGVVPEAAFPPDVEVHLTPIGAREFLERWAAARRRAGSAATGIGELITMSKVR